MCCVCDTTALHYITLHYITLHYITLHYIRLPLHYVTLHYRSDERLRISATPSAARQSQFQPPIIQPVARNAETVERAWLKLECGETKRAAPQCIDTQGTREHNTDLASRFCCIHQGCTVSAQEWFAHRTCSRPALMLYSKVIQKIDFGHDDGRHEDHLRLCALSACTRTNGKLEERTT